MGWLFNTCAALGGVLFVLWERGAMAWPWPQKAVLGVCLGLLVATQHFGWRR